MNGHTVVDAQQWLQARLALLEREKEMSRLRDELTQMRRNLPWERVADEYTFVGPDGMESLSGLFGECSQLIVYHFMFDPEWDEGCKICSLLGDHMDPLVVHLRHRDVTLVIASRAPLEKITAYRERMGWSFKWVSSYESRFNWDFHVSFSQEELDSGKAYYNYQEGTRFPVTEAPGISSFFKDESGTVYHSYSSFGRGLENFLGIYHFLDIVPKGRDEATLPYGMAWVQRKDEYGAPSCGGPLRLIRGRFGSQVSLGTAAPMYYQRDGDVPPAAHLDSLDLAVRERCRRGGSFVQSRGSSVAGQEVFRLSWPGRRGARGGLASGRSSISD